MFYEMIMKLVQSYGQTIMSASILSAIVGFVGIFFIIGTLVSIGSVINKKMKTKYSDNIENGIFVGGSVLGAFSFCYYIVFTTFLLNDPSQLSKGLCFERKPLEKKSQVQYILNKQHEYIEENKILSRKIELVKKLKTKNSDKNYEDVIADLMTQMIDNETEIKESKTVLSNYKDYFEDTSYIVVLDNLDGKNISYNTTKNKFIDNLTYSDLYSDKYETKKVECSDELKKVVNNYNTQPVDDFNQNLKIKKYQIDANIWYENRFAKNTFNKK